jgi:hypothetical protein
MKSFGYLCVIVAGVDVFSLLLSRMRKRNDIVQKFLYLNQKRGLR